MKLSRAFVSALVGATLAVGTVAAGSLPAAAASRSTHPTTDGFLSQTAESQSTTDTPTTAAPAHLFATGKVTAVARGTVERGLVMGPLDNTVLVPETAARPCDRPVGRVRLAGPDDIWLAGTARCARNVWTMTVAGGTGTVGGVTLLTGSFSGTVSWDSTGVSSSVRIALPLQPRIAAAWDQSARVELTRNRGPWSGVVYVRATSGDTIVKLDGLLQAGNTYRLTGGGNVSFASTRVPVTGWYQSASGNSGARWSLSGSGPDGHVPGAQIIAPSVQLKPSGISGRATVQVDAPTSLRFPATLRMSTGEDWSLAAGAPTVTRWTPSGMAGATVNVSRLSGAIGQTAGRNEWTLTAPMSMNHDRLAITGDFDFRGASWWRVRPSSATGQILDLPETLTFTGSGAMNIDSGKVSGALQMRTAGELLIDLPGGYDTSTSFSLVPLPGRTVSFREEVSYRAVNGTSAFALVGEVNGSDAYHLIAVGHFDIAGTEVPVGGEFDSVGWVRDGVTLTEPYWNMKADIQGAPGGKVSLGGGAALSGGSFGFEGHGAPVAPAGVPADVERHMRSASYTASSVRGYVEVQLSSNSSYSVTSSYTYTDANNWTVTAAGNSSNPWSPFAGLSIPETSFTGTITDTAGHQTWNITVPNVAWTNMTDGATMATTTFTMSNTCPLSNQANCPQGVSAGVYVGASTASISFTDGTPTVTSNGAFLADGSWAYWQANVAPLTWNGITMSNVKLVAWHGPRTDSDPNLTMPDLSGGKLGFEFCGDFQVQVPDISTVSTSGCTEWNRNGVVMAQAMSVGSFTTQPSNNVNINGGQLAGFGWTNLSAAQTVLVHGVALTLEPNAMNITANLTVPGSLMHDLGTGSSSDTVIAATGWFSSAGDFAISATIPVNLQASGVTLTAITVGGGKDGHNFTISFGAEADARVNGQHYPVVATISAETQGATVRVSLDIKGSRTIQMAGGFDASNLLPTGNFEPAGMSTIDGSFDGNQAANVIGDGGFENGSDKSSLVANSSFENNTQNELITNGGFETSSGQELLDNSDFEDTNVLRNGDFDYYLDDGTGSYLGWTVDSNFSASVVSDAAPTGDPGTYAVQVRNTKSSTTSAAGLRQDPRFSAQPGGHYRLTAWVKAVSGNGTAQISLLRASDYATCGSQTNSQTRSLTTGDGWQKVTLDYTHPSSCGNAQLTIVIDPYSGSFTMAVDSVALDIVSLPANTIGSLSYVNMPDLHGRFDRLEQGTYSSDSYWSSSYGGSLRSDGCSEWFYLDGAGYMSGDFDASVDVYFPSGDNKRDIFDFAFGMNGSGTSATGWAYRVQSSSTDSGFYKITGNGGKSALDGSNTDPLARDTWYTLRLQVSGKRATAWVFKISDGTQLSKVTTDLPSEYSGSGYFGQAMDNACSNSGHYIDNFSARSQSGNTTLVRYDPANARPHTDGSTNNGYLRLQGGAANWNAQYDVRQDSSSISGTYTYSAWVKSTGSDVHGSLTLDTLGGTYESASQPITVTSTWTKVSVSLPIRNSGHVSLRPGFTAMDSSNVAIYVDDQSLAQMQWSPSSGNNAVAMGCSEDAHTGTASMSFTDRSGSNFIYNYVATPVPGARYHVSMWVKSNQQWSGTLYLSLGSSWGSVDFTTNAPDSSGAVDWKQVTLDYSPVSTTNMLAVQLSSGSGTIGKELLIDDVSLTATFMADHLSGGLGDIPQPPGWSTSQGDPRVILDPEFPHSGSAFMRVNVANNSVRTAYTYTPSSGTLAGGQKYTLDLWMKSPDGSGGTGTAQLTANGGSCASGTTTRSITFGGGYQEMLLDCTLGTSGATSFTVTLYSSTTTRRIDVDDVQLQTAGMSLFDPWSVTGIGGTPSVVGVNDAGTAHSGSSYVALTCVGTAAKMFMDAAYDSSQGIGVSAGVWLRSATGSTISAQLVVTGYDSSGNAVATNSVGITVSGTAWGLHYVSQTFPGYAVKLRTEIQNNTAGSTLYIDDLDSRPLGTWAAYAPNPWSFVHQINDSTTAASGTGFLRMNTWGTAPTSDRSGVAATLTQTINSGTRYDVQAYVKSPGNWNTTGRLGLTYGVGQSNAETSYQSFTANGAWQLVQFSFTAAASHGSSQTRVFIETENGGELDVDQISLTPKVLANPDGWVNSSDGGGSGTWQNLNDATNAHDGSSGVVALSKSSSTGRAGIACTVSTGPAQGSSYTINAWVRSPSGTSISGALEMTFNGGTSETVSKSFTTPSNGTWTLVSTMIKAANTGHTGITTKVLQSSSGTLYVDDVALQRLDWTGVADSGSTVTQQIMYDAVSAQAGSGYLRLRNQGTAQVYARVDTSGSFAQGTTEYVSVWVRSTSGAPVTGTLLVGPAGGASASQNFTATSDWQKVSVNYLLPAAYSSLRTQVRLDANAGDVSLDVDSMTISDQSGAPDGVSSALAHPESGYAYLWDNAFGIKGAHLWDMTAQVQVSASGAGLGIGATVYFDPTQMPDIMTGTAWIKGNMTVNIARADPCFAVDFDAGDSGSAVSINHGTLTATQFTMYFAPRGCTVGSRVVPAGGSLAFNAAIGNATVSFSLIVSKDADGNTEMHGSAGLANLVLGGLTFNSLTMTVDKTVTDTTVTMAGDLTLPNGSFTTSLDLSVGEHNGLLLKGDATLKDWKMAGGGFDVQSASISIDIEVPAGSDACVTLDTGMSGQMTMAKKSGLSFDGHLTVDCGELQVLHLAYSYYHAAVESDFVLDYHEDTGILSGGAYFAFNRSTSWKFLGYRYRRHPSISIGLTYSMDVNNPSAATEARLAGSVSVSGGSGSLDCTISSSGDDSCSISVRINIGGGHSYSDTW